MATMLFPPGLPSRTDRRGSSRSHRTAWLCWECCLGEEHLPHVQRQRNKCQITLDKPVKERQPVTGVNHTSLPRWSAPEHTVGRSSRCRKQALVFVPCGQQQDEGEKASTSTCLFKKDTVALLGQQPSLPQERVTPERKSWPQTHPLQHLGKKKSPLVNESQIQSSAVHNWNFTQASLITRDGPGIVRREDKDSLQRAPKVAKSPPPEGFWKDVRLIKKKKEKNKQHYLGQITFQDGFVRDSLQANTHPPPQQAHLGAAWLRGDQHAGRAPRSRSLQPDLGWHGLILSWGGGEAFGLLPPVQSQKEMSSCFLAVYLALNTMIISGLPITRRREVQHAGKVRSEEDGKKKKRPDL